jgi:hypothetical protein
MCRRLSSCSLCLVCAHRTAVSFGCWCWLKHSSKLTKTNNGRNGFTSVELSKLRGSSNCKFTANMLKDNSWWWTVFDSACRRRFRHIRSRFGKIQLTKSSSNTKRNDPDLNPIENNMPVAPPGTHNVSLSETRPRKFNGFSTMLRSSKFDVPKIFGNIHWDRTKGK